MKALWLYTDPERAFDLLGEYAGLYGDNGGDPDGNAWLPDVSEGDIPEDLSQAVVAAGYGEMVTVQVETVETLLRRFNIPAPGDWDDLAYDLLSQLKQALNQAATWAHYGIYRPEDEIILMAEQ